MYNKNASEPVWFRGVAASMVLCFDIGAGLEGHPDVVLAVNGDVVIIASQPEFRNSVNGFRPRSSSK